MRATDREFSTALAVADVLASLRKRKPRVHCITNSVAQAYTANMLLALGAAPSMTTAPDEIGDFADSADAILVNMGTMDAERRTAIAAALDAAPGKPWVLDPVFVDRTRARLVHAKGLLGRKPSVLRLNRAEFGALAGTEASAASVTRFARETGTVIGLTGDPDLVTDGVRLAAIANGHPWMGLVTAMGCAGSAVVAAALAVESDPFAATVSALVAMGVAGERAAEASAGPGSFGIAVIDAVHTLDGVTAAARARVTFTRGQT